MTAGVDSDGRLVVATAQSAPKPDAERDPRTSVVVLSDDWDGAWVQIDGAAEVLHMPQAADDRVDDVRRISGEHPHWNVHREAVRLHDTSLAPIAPRA